jgi:hypothetical protein
MAITAGTQFRGAGAVTAAGERRCKAKCFLRAI